MQFENIIHSGMELIKVESTPQIIKQTRLIDSEFEFLQQPNLLLDVMHQYNDITINQTTMEPILSKLFLKNDKRTTRNAVAILLGKYAEALMVMNCNANGSFNRHFARKARFGKKSPNDFLDNFIAISTGSKDTKSKFPMHYQYTESQRDIVWVNKRDILQLLTIPKKHGATAGLQLKISYDWKNVENKLTQYYYPILYFSLSDDWSELNDFINTKKKEGVPGYEKVTLLEMDDYSNKVLSTLKYFEQELILLCEGKVGINYLIDKAKAEREAAIGHAISRQKGSDYECLITTSAIVAAHTYELYKEKKNLTQMVRLYK